jgi:hypothetical protein
MCAKTYIKKDKKADNVLGQLRKLPKQFILLKNVFLRLTWPVTHQKTLEKVKACQIDYLVIGPSGVSIVEAKNWDENSFADLIPYKEADQAGLVVYIKLRQYFNKTIPIYNIIITFRKTPIIQYGYVHQLSLWDLTTFIFEQGKFLSKSEIRALGKIFKGNIR